MRFHKTTALLLGLAILSIGYAFHSIHPPQNYRNKVHRLPAHPQDTTGDAAAGWDYVRYGNYIGAGVPYNIFKLAVRGKMPNHLNREGKAANIPHPFNTFQENGVEVVGGLNCFGCHAGKINGEFIPGLGNNASDFADGQNQRFFKNLQRMVRFRYGKRSGQYAAYLPLARGAEYVTPYTQTPFVGINPAFKLEEAAVAHRHPHDLTWADGAQTFPLTEQIVGSDVPPLWHLQKKNALYYNAMGRGDFTKLLMQVMVVAIEDSTEAREIHSHFDDVVAWIRSIEPPRFPSEINTRLAANGKSIFDDKCSKCHGTYDTDQELYPNALVGIDIVKTDTAYAHYAHYNDGFNNWLNQSWIMQSEPRAWVQPELAYIAPPLDGIWATAPYLHNGAIPDLMSLLDSRQRPALWRRTSQDGENNYDLERVGLRYEAVTAATDKWTYNTHLPGYSNVGHYFADDLNDNQRLALLEYLKTL